MHIIAHIRNKYFGNSSCLDFDFEALTLGIDPDLMFEFFQKFSAISEEPGFVSSVIFGELFVKLMTHMAGHGNGIYLSLVGRSLGTSRVFF